MDDTLKSIDVLTTHYVDGGLNHVGFETLYRMLKLIPAIEDQIANILLTRTMEEEKFRSYNRCILDVCNAFHENMMSAVDDALDARNSLPELDGDVTVLKGRLKQWQAQLR